MNKEEVKQKILKIFEENRQDKGGEYEESHFLDFLVTPPAKKGKLRSSFRSLWKYNNFIDAIELEFGICFTQVYMDSDYSLEDLIKTVVRRKTQMHGNTIIIDKRLQKKKHYFLEIVLSFLILVMFEFLRTQGFVWYIFAILLICIFLLFILLFLGHIYSTHNKNLKIKIDTFR